MRISDWSSDVCSSDLQRITVSTSRSIDGRFGRGAASPNGKAAPGFPVMPSHHPYPFSSSPVSVATCSTLVDHGVPKGTPAIITSFAPACPIPWRRPLPFPLPHISPHLLYSFAATASATPHQAPQP